MKAVRWIWLLVPAALAACAVWMFLAHSTRYHDRFTQGRADEWQAIGGSWKIVDGAMENDSDERGAKLLTGSTGWKDYSLTADVELLGPAGDAGLIVRSNDEERGVDAYSGYYVGLRTADDSLVMGRADHGWMEGDPTPMPGGVHARRWYHLKIVVVGCSISATANETGTRNSVRALFKEKDCVTSGRIGLRSLSTGAAWRNVRVAPAVADDLLPVSSRVTRILHPDYAKSEAAYNATHTYLKLTPRPIPAPGSPPKPSLQTIGSLRLVRQTVPHPVVVRGVVTSTTPMLFIQDSTGGAAIPDADTSSLNLGDEVEATGIPAARPYSVVLRYASTRLLWDRTPVAPLSITAGQAATGVYDATLVETQGHLLSRRYGSGNTLILKLVSGPQAFRAIVSGGDSSALYRRLTPHSLLNLRGICTLDSRFTQHATPFALLLGSAQDVDVLAGPPWWSTPRLIELGFALLLLALLGQYAYGQAEKWRLRAIVRERERLAHELHDTLAQSFAGVSFQLQGIRNGLRHATPASLDRIHQQLDVACAVVRNTHEEASLSIAMLRQDAPERQDLASALRLCASTIVAGGSIAIEVMDRRDDHALPLRTADALFHIGREAIVNSVRHARPVKISVLIDDRPGTVLLTVEDVGAGFNTSTEPRGFGLRGMEKRALSIGATLKIESTPGVGTRVQVAARLTERLSWRDFAQSAWRAMIHKQANH